MKKGISYTFDAKIIDLKLGKVTNLTKANGFKDLCVFKSLRFYPNFKDADLAVLARFVHFFGHHWGQQTARKV